MAVAENGQLQSMLYDTSSMSNVIIIDNDMSIENGKNLSRKMFSL